MSRIYPIGYPEQLPPNLWRAGQAPLLHDPCPSPLSAAYSLLDTPQLNAMLTPFCCSFFLPCFLLFSASQPASPHSQQQYVQHHSSLNTPTAKSPPTPYFSLPTPPPPYRTPKKKLALSALVPCIGVSPHYSAVVSYPNPSLPCPVSPTTFTPPS